MSNRAPLGHHLAMVLAMALLPTIGRAQAPAAPGAEAPWVQVDVLVFRHLDGSTAGNEAWPAAPRLGYPEPVEILLAPGSPAHAAALAAREFDAALQAEEGSAAQPLAAPELPFLLLADADSVLAPRAARLASAPAYRLLARLAWRQPLPVAGRPVSVLLTGGAQTGTHYEVEGFVTLSRARYLHADLSLWLNDFTAAPAGSDERGVLLPEVPLPRLPAADLSAAAPPALDGGVSAGDGIAAPDALAAPSAAATLSVEPQRSARTVLLHTARRLAPGELHYLDHPLFGVLLSARSWDPAAGVPGADAGTAPPAGAEETPPPP